MLTGFKCTRCGKLVENPLGTGGRCPSCRGTLLAEYDFSDVDPQMLDGGSPYEGVWRFRCLLPPSSSEISLGEGGTPLLRALRLSEKLKLAKIMLKNEGENPTGSFMDRGCAVLVSKLLDQGVKGVYGAFKGNLGASLAAYTARAGLECLALLREPVDAAKLYQMIAYGAKLEVQRSDVDLGEEYYCAGSADPYLLEGFKTACYEICCALGWRAPEVLVVPVGSGALITAVWKGLRELEALGLIDESSTRLIGVQPSPCAPIVEEVANVKLPRGESIVVDLAFPEPERGAEAVKAIRESGGAAIAVSEADMVEASRSLAKLEGIFAELAAASTIAALVKAVEEGLLDRGEEVVCLVTGSGLKDPTAALREAERNLALERLIKGLKTPGRRVLGATKLEILRILRERDLHGYGVWRELLERGHDITMPVVYQHLRELKSMGLVLVKEVQVVKNRRRDIYTLSKKGRAVLEILSP